MNPAPAAQDITNQIALYTGNCLAYIDDICIKHHFELGTVGAKEQLDRFAFICRKVNVQLNPTKFYPCCDYNENFGFQNTMIREMVSDVFKDKLIACVKPNSKAEVRSMDGLLNYVNNHIYHNKLLTYWIKQMDEITDSKTKRVRLKWTIAFTEKVFLTSLQNTRQFLKIQIKSRYEKQ